MFSSSRHFHFVDYFPDDLTRRPAFHFFFWRKDDAVSQYSGQDIHDVVRRYKIPPPHGRDRLATVQYGHGRTRARTEVQGFVVSGFAHKRSDILEDFVLDVYLPRYVLCIDDLAGR